MDHKKTTSAVLASLLLSLNCAASSTAFAADDLVSYFDGASQASLAELVGNMRADKAQDPRNPEPQPTQPQTGNNELLHFWEDLKDDVFDDICKEVELPIEQDFDLGSIGGIEGKFERYMKQYPDNKIAVIDEVKVKLDAGHTFSDIFSVGDNSFNIGFSGALEGKSIVVRKTNEDKYCKNILKMLDLRKVKTILPVNAKRIAGMQTNEIWKFPAVMRMSISGGIGYPVQPWATISMSLGNTRETRPSVTLFRMDDKRLRMRIRLDRIHVKSGSFSAGTSVDAGLIGLPEAENILMKELNKTIVKDFNKYLAFKLGLSHSRVKGKKILLEFIIDPTDKNQVDRLVEFLNGDLGIIRKLIAMGVRFNDFSDMDDTAQGAQALQNVEQVAGQELGLNSTFAGSDHFTGSSNGLNAMIPILVHRESNNGRRYDRYQTLGGDQVLHVHNTNKNVSVSNINIPIVGKIFKHNTHQNFYAVNYEDKNGVFSDTALVYQRYEGYVKHDERDARGMVVEMNEILKYAGTLGNGVNNEFTVDVDALFPRLAAEEANPSGTDADGNPIPDTKRYKSAIMAFSLVFTKEAVKDIMAAPPATLMKAVLNVMDGLEREIVDAVKHLFKIDAAGKIDYDWKAARKLLSKYERDGDEKYDPLTAVNSFCRNVAQVVADIASLRNAPDQKTRAERLSLIMAGKGKSGIGYENMLQVVIQLVSVKDIYATLNVQTDKRIKGEENISSTYNLYNNHLQAGYGEHLNAANSLRDRFADPSILSD